MIAVTIMVLCEDETTAVKVGEILNRAAAGIALEGHSVSVTYNTVEEEQEN